MPTFPQHARDRLAQLSQREQRAGQYRSMMLLRLDEGWRLARGIACMLALGLTLTSALGRAQAPTANAPISEAGCGECHPAQQRAVAGSQHALAMQPATSATVLGDFADATFTKDAVTTRFFRRDGRYFVNTDGPDGKLADFEVRYTFGIDPLQQYLVALPGGRLQALTIAWDTKAKRWFDTYPNERINHKDPLHWTRGAQNWNAMCAACHATEVRKNYDAGKDAYQTTWQALGVGCQSCHGPAAGHVAWAREKRNATAADGKPVDSKAIDGKGGGGTARLRGFDADVSAASGKAQVDACGYCHALRSPLTPGYVVGQPLLDHALPVGLDETHYFNDGQQREEVFVLGSWLQTKMHAKGLVCSDCHDAHTGKTVAPGNAVCTSCHNPSGPAARPHIDVAGLKRRNYDTTEHTHHPAAVTCVECHAPKRAYMVVDPRLDHAFRIPRPDLSVETGAPNACNGCHKDHDAAWATAAVARWYGADRRAEAHYGQALAAAREGRPGAAAGLQRVAGDRAQPAIVRAAAITELSAYPGARSLELARAALHDQDAQVRIAGLEAVVALGGSGAQRDVAPLLSDPVRAVRIEAALRLAAVQSRLPPDRRDAWQAARAELETAAKENSDRPQSWIGLAQIAMATGDRVAAERALRRALQLEPSYVPAIANLADLMRATGRDADGEALLREALRRAPNDIALQQALALALVRQQRKAEALRVLASAQALPTATSRTAYLYALSLADAGRTKEAIAVLEKAARKRADRDLLLALAAYRRAGGDPAGAKAALDWLATINPGDPALL